MRKASNEYTDEEITGMLQLAKKLRGPKGNLPLPSHLERERLELLSEREARVSLAAE
jgi:hypothetical protein